MERLLPKPHIVVAVAVASGLFFIAGGLVATNEASTRWILLATAVTLAAMTVAILVFRRRQADATALRFEAEERIAQLERHREALRTRMTYTLREPLASIVGFADSMAHDTDMSFADRSEMLTAIRDNAREVERILADLATGDGSALGPRVEGIVLLDEEVRSVAASTWSRAEVAADLSTTRAWADSARVRQILRIVINAAWQSGCAYITLTTDQRQKVASVTISGRDDLLDPPAIAALTGNTEEADLSNEMFKALLMARELATEMGGSIGYAQAFGASHIVIELPAAPDDHRMTEIKPKVQPRASDAAEAAPTQPASSRISFP